MRFAGPRAKLIRFRFYYYYDSKLLSLVCIPLFSSLPFSLLVLYRSGRCAVATYTANTCNIVMRRLKYLNPCLCSSLWYSFSFSFFFIVSGFFFFTDTEKFVDGGKCQMYHCLYTDIHWPNNVRHPISLFSFFFIFLFFHCFFHLFSASSSRRLLLTIRRVARFVFLTRDGSRLLLSIAFQLRW